MVLGVFLGPVTTVVNKRVHGPLLLAMQISAGQRNVPRDRTPLDQLMEEGGRVAHQSQGQAGLKVEQKFASIQEIVELYELVHERHSF